MKVGLILPYFAPQWPIWMPAFLHSCAANPHLDWFIFSNCPGATDWPANVHHIPSSLAAVSALASERLGAPVELRYAYKLCDLRPAYAEVFADWLTGYDFWGYCDLDVIWGDLSKELYPELLAETDAWSSRQGVLSGHLTLLRHTPTINRLYRHLPDFYGQLNHARNYNYSEAELSRVIREQAPHLRVIWDRCRVNHPPERQPKGANPAYLAPRLSNRWRWQEGRMEALERGGKRPREVPYLHFLPWKHQMRFCEVKWPEPVPSFYISYAGIHHRPLSLGQRAWLYPWIRLQNTWRLARGRTTPRMYPAPPDAASSSTC